MVGRISRGLCLLVAVAPLGCSTSEDNAADEALRATMASIAEAIEQACPVKARDDEAARDACANALADLEVLSNSMTNTLEWGGHRTDIGTLDPEEHNTTRFQNLVLRKLYMSTFMFSGEYEIVEEEDFMGLVMEAEFRNEMDIGAYPYPFWHAKGKWDAYQNTEAFLIVFDRKTQKIVSSYRQAGATGPQRDPGPWDGEWVWTDTEGHTMPYVTLYDYLLSSDNPHRDALDTAYRELEQTLREADCMTCHVPDNQAEMSPLVLFSYPAQALGDRHILVDTLKDNIMPPGSIDKPKPGIEDTAVLDELITLSEEFAQIGDDALGWEGVPY